MKKITLTLAAFALVFTAFAQDVVIERITDNTTALITTNGDEDALYYLLLALEQSKVKVENLQVILSSTASFKTKLDKYFNKITITSPNRCDLNIPEEDKVICSIV